MRLLRNGQSRMKEDKGERFFHFMSTEVIEKTSREFAELMTSNIHEMWMIINSDKIK